MNSDTPPHDVRLLLPALTDELDRVRLDVEIARRDRQIDDLRASLTAEEADQRLAQIQIDGRVRHLRHDIERISAEIPRLEARLERLSFSRRALSDSELDDEEQVERAEEAAFWAEWRRQRDERGGQAAIITHRPRGDEDVILRQTYRTLARLIHPDLARDLGDRSRREALMRLANAANEARDIEQLRRLVILWSRPEAGATVRDLGAMRARLAERELEHDELRRQIIALEQSSLGRLIRRPKAELARHIKREEERLRRDIATLRLRRRRLLATLEDRRRNLAQASD